VEVEYNNFYKAGCYIVIMDLENFLGIEPHLERALMFIGIAVTIFGVLSLLSTSWQKNIMIYAMSGFLILAFLQFILFIHLIFK